MLQKRQIRTDEPEIGRFGTRDSGFREREMRDEGKGSLDGFLYIFILSINVQEE